MSGRPREETTSWARRLVLAGTIAAAWAVLAGAAEPAQREAARFDLEALLAQFAAMPGLTARFREERRIALLRQPLLSHGVLYFAPPDRLLRHVREPLESSLLLRGNTLTLGSTRGTRTIDLGANPVARSFVDSFRLLLAGDIEALRATYRVRFEAAEAAGGGTQRGWEVRLEPLLASVQQAIAWIRLSGRGRVLLELEVREVSGDVTLTRFSAVDTERHFSDRELEELFQRSVP
jgi:hypothetical protein